MRHVLQFCNRIGEITLPIRPKLYAFTWNLFSFSLLYIYSYANLTIAGVRIYMNVWKSVESSTTQKKKKDS